MIEPLIRLLEGKVPADDELREIKSYADGIGPNTRLIIPANADRTLQPPSDLVSRAHAVGLTAHHGGPEGPHYTR